MTKGVHQVPAYNDVRVAARIMWKHRIHHVVVTSEQKLVGIISSFDLLKLIQDNTFKATSPAQSKNNRARTPVQKRVRAEGRKAAAAR